MGLLCSNTAPFFRSDTATERAADTTSPSLSAPALRWLKHTDHKVLQRGGAQQIGSAADATATAHTASGGVVEEEEEEELPAGGAAAASCAWRSDLVGF